VRGVPSTNPKTLADVIYFVLNENPVSPTMVTTTPPINSQIARSVGAPVKRREKSDPNESEALTPKMISTMPRISSTSETGVFIRVPLWRFPTIGNRLQLPGGSR
jgi:hypothetical protein